MTLQWAHCPVCNFGVYSPEAHSWECGPCGRKLEPVKPVPEGLHTLMDMLTGMTDAEREKWEVEMCYPSAVAMLDPDYVTECIAMARSILEARDD